MSFSLEDIFYISMGDEETEFKTGRQINVWIKPTETKIRQLFKPPYKPQHYGLKTTDIILQGSNIAKLQAFTPITLYRNDVIKFASGTIVLKGTVTVGTSETEVGIYSSDNEIALGEESVSYGMLPFYSVKEGGFPQKTTTYAEAHNKNQGLHPIFQKIKEDATATITGDLNVKDPCFYLLESIKKGNINKIFVQIRDMPLQENYGQSPLTIEFWATSSVTYSDSESGFVNFSLELKVIGYIDDYTIPTGVFFTLIPPSITLVSDSSVNVTQSLLLTANVTAGSYDIDKVEFYQNGVLLDEDLTEPYTTSVAFDASELGNNTFYAIVYDTESNQVQSNTKTVEVTYTPPTITVGVSPSSVNENELTPMVYTFTRTGFTGVSTSVTYGISGTAVNGVDYNNIGTSINFGINETTKTVDIIPIDNDTVASNKTVTLTINSGGDYSVGNPSSATGTIVNDDVIPFVTLSVSPSSVLENSGTPLVYTFTRAGSTGNAITVNYTISGTAVNGTDYQTIGTTVSFSAGQSTRTVNVTPINNSSYSLDKTVTLTLASGTGYEIGTVEGVTATIIDDETETVRVNVGTSSVHESYGAYEQLTYIFSRLTNLGSVTVNFSASGTATLGVEYTVSGATSFDGTNGTIILDGVSSNTLIVTPINVLTDSINKTLTITVESGGYAIGSPSSASGTIISNPRYCEQDITGFYDFATNP